MKKMAAILLAAGQGTRMKSSLPKVLHEISGLPLIHYPIEIAKELKLSPIVLVVGHQADQIKDKLKNNTSLRFATQKNQLGSAHAVLAAEQSLNNFKGTILIFSGDVPLIQRETIQKMIEFHRSQKNDLTLGTLHLENPTGYGRIFRNQFKQVIKIVEETDLSEPEKKIKEINGGLYMIDAELLFKNLKKIKKNSIKKEYYFTDLIQILNDQNFKVGGFLIEPSSELLGINNRVELAHAEKLIQQRIHKKLMLSGVTFISPDRTMVQNEVQIGIDTVVHPDVTLIGKTKIGKEVVLEQGVILKNTIVEDRVLIHSYSHLENCIVRSGAMIGPFARIRPESVIGKNAKIGNFVELKKTELGEGSKANHLSYLGDAIIGKNVNIGAGTITCNYDGVKKYQTKIEDEVFVGSDTQFVAPVKIGKKAYIGAGTTVTQDVPPEALAISRVPQKNISGYAKKRIKS